MEAMLGACLRTTHSNIYVILIEGGLILSKKVDFYLKEMSEKRPEKGGSRLSIV